ncbi:RNA polymerase sigma factor [Actinomadura soli]|uniref:RNA polymerase sigma factor n=1 Tax=Actinomadura soli TaxID=2508997 RepID=UPI0014874DF8|nr:sigma-70 family RNA polymerase sigma factor [Actinomadura soli]
MGQSETDRAAVPAQRAPAPAGFAQFYRDHYRSLIALAMALGATWEEAEDAVGKTMLEVLRRWVEIRFPLAYASRAVKSNFIKQRQHQREEVPRAIKGGHERPEAQPDALMCEWEDNQWVEQIVGTLPPAQRDVARLILINGMSTAEAADELEKSQDAVRQNLRLAKARLRKLLKDQQRLELEMERRVQTSTGPDGRKLDDQ